MQNQHPQIVAPSAGPAPSANESGQLTITHQVLNLVAASDEFKGRWASMGQLLPVRLIALQRVAAMESAAAAARLAGARCSDRRVGEYLAGKTVKQADLSLNARLIVKGYNSVLKLINSSYPQIAFIESHVRQLHGLVLEGYRAAGQNETTELDPLAAELIKETDILIRESPLHPLLVIAIFSFRFWHQKSFSQGSGRLTWLLSRLLLLRSGYSFVAYGSLEHFMEKSLPAYQEKHHKQENTQSKKYDHDWLIMFLEAMAGVQADLTGRIGHEKEVLKLGNPYREIIRVVQEHGQSTISRIMEVTGVNRNTLKIRLRKLVAEKYLVQHGCGKGTYYTIQGLHLQ